MEDLTEFQAYLIQRIDRIDRDINKLHIKVIKSASIYGALSGVITTLFALLLKIKL